jgi:uncharacterized protein YndB with AHSA1/START domain
MTATPTGRLGGTPDRPELQLERVFAAPLDDVWASITEPERTARWFADWTGDGAPGATVRLRFVHEDGQPEGDLEILACEPPHRLEVLTEDEGGRWHLEARLAERDGGTVLTFVHHLQPGEDLASTGAGWEYYLDLLVASRDGGPAPDFADYHPGMSEYYRALSGPPSTIDR